MVLQTNEGPCRIYVKVLAELGGLKWSHDGKLQRNNGVAEPTGSLSDDALDGAVQALSHLPGEAGTHGSTESPAIESATAHTLMLEQYLDGPEVDVDLVPTPLKFPCLHHSSDMFIRNRTWDSLKSLVPMCVEDEDLLMSWQHFSP